VRTNRKIRGETNSISGERNPASRKKTTSLPISAIREYLKGERRERRDVKKGN